MMPDVDQVLNIIMDEEISDGNMKKVIFSLALGTFGLGMAEFGIMGVLTELARDVGITIPAAGHMISFYAFGVVLGAPIIALFSSRFTP